MVYTIDLRTCEASSQDLATLQFMCRGGGMVYTLVLGTSTERRAGSTPVPGTIIELQGLRIYCPQGRGGSTPLLGTIEDFLKKFSFWIILTS